jgi:glutamate dehydrogenase (NAD(P)+)
MKIIAVSDVSGGIDKETGLDIYKTTAFLEKNRKNLLVNYHDKNARRLF